MQLDDETMDDLHELRHRFYDVSDEDLAAYVQKRDVTGTQCFVGFVVSVVTWPLMLGMAIFNPDAFMAILLTAFTYFCVLMFGLCLWHNSCENNGRKEIMRRKAENDRSAQRENIRA